MDYFDILLAKKLSGGGGGGEITVEGLNVEENGTYTAPSGKAYSPVVVNLPLGEKAITANGEYNASADDLKGYSKVTVNVAGFKVKDMPTGAISSISDGTDNPLKELKVSIVPVQSGSGDPSPTNPRPISGRTGANVNVTGVNIWDEIWEVGNIDSSGNNSESTARIRSTNYIPCKPNASYYLKELLTTSDIKISYYSKDKSFISQTNWLGNIVFTSPSEAYYLRFATTNTYGTVYLNDISINYPSTDTDYHAYNGTTYPLTWQTEAGTVYGGELNVTSGVLTDEMFRISGTDITTLSLDSTNPTATTFTFSYNANNFPKGKANTAISNRFSRSIPSGTVGRLVNTATQIYFIVPTNELQTVDVAGCKQWIEDNPTDFIYEVDTPTTYQLTPTQVSSILGNNNIWADCGDVISGKYFASL